MNPVKERDIGLKVQKAVRQGSISGASVWTTVGDRFVQTNGQVAALVMMEGQYSRVDGSRVISFSHVLFHTRTPPADCKAFQREIRISVPYTVTRHCLRIVRSPW